VNILLLCFTKLPQRDVKKEILIECTANPLHCRQLSSGCNLSLRIHREAIAAPLLVL
jgi:hypothetical protein